MLGFYLTAGTATETVLLSHRFEILKILSIEGNGTSVGFYAPFEQWLFDVPRQIAAELKLAYSLFGQSIDATRNTVAVNSE